MVRPIKKVVEEVSSQLEQIYDAAEAKNIAMILLEDKHNIDRTDFLAEVEMSFDNELLQSDVDRLLANEPIQYVTETVFFYGRKFMIKKGALIPRPETEELVHLIVNGNKVDKPRILDVGSGSGCISISLEKELKGETIGIDISEDAIDISKENAQGLHSKTTFSHCNILEEQPTVDNLDILVSNPPYIPSEEKKLMHKNVLDFEPGEALFVPDSNPLLFYERIAEQGLDLLKDGGKLYFEIHENFGGELKTMIQNLGYQDVKTHLDMQGKERMVCATHSANN